MSAAEFVEQLRGLDVVLTADNGRLRCSAPPDVLTDSLRAELTRRKGEILEVLISAAAEREPLIVAPATNDRRLRLAVPQERIWFLHQLDPASSAYTIAPAARVRGPIDMAALQYAWDQVVLRHETLRTTFPIVDGEPVPQVHPAGSIAIRLIDVTDVPAAGREAAALQRGADEADLPFDIEQGPLCRVSLVRIAEDDHLIVIAIHHIVCDQWSIGILGRELHELYEAHREGRVPRLPELAVRYTDYADAHREWLNGPRLQGQLAYWKRQLAGLTPTEIPGDRPRTAAAQRGGARQSRVLPPRLLQAARALGRVEHASLFMVLVAAFKTVMTRYTGQTDISVGTPIANRTVTAVEGLVGTFVNTLVFRSDTSGNPTFRALLGRVRDTALDAMANQDLSFERLVNELHLPRDGNRAPLFQVLFNVQNAPADVVELPGIQISSVLLSRRSTQFDLTVSVDTEVEGRISYSYNPARFDAITIETLFEHYESVLEEVTADPDVQLSDIALMGQAERAKILRSWNATCDPRAADDTLLSLFNRHVHDSPAAIAVECGAKALTYRDLDDESNRVAHYLRSHGAGTGTLVGICLNRSADLVVTLLGVLKTGAAYLPLDPAFPADRLAFMLEDSKAGLVVVETGLRHLIPAGVPAVVVCVDADADAIGSMEPTDGPSPVRGSSLAYVLYTSGSTGRPKGVEISHRSLANLLLSMQREPGMSASDRLLSVTTLSFDIAGLELYLPLVTGARVHLATREQATDPTALAALIDTAGITMMQATPATWRMLLEDGWAGRPELTILCGGEAMTRDLADRLLGRARTVWNVYGPTETTIWSTVERVIPSDEPVSIGRPIANTEVYVLDRHLHPVPAGVAGELFIGGDGVARGYLNRPELTAERFVPDLFSGRPGARLYRTGDLARFRRDGRLECLGRLDHQVKVNGFRIELGEIEAALSSHEDVAAAAVALRTDRGGGPRLVGYVVKAAGSPAGVEGLRAHLSQRLPAYMVPAQLVDLESLPLTPNGKVDRAALPEPAAPAAASPASLGPGSADEQKMAAIWADVLNVPAVGLDDDFFDLGGHSLLAVRLMGRIAQAFDRKIALARLFEARTVRQLAALVQSGTKAGWISLVPVQRLGSRPPFFCVHGVGGEVLTYSALAARLAPDQPFVAFRASGYDGTSKPLNTIEEQASLYVREMIAFQPDGPYYIGGYSSGGRVALEMALQLEAQGKQVAFLGIIDTTPSPAAVPALRYLGRWLANLPRWIRYDLMRSSREGNLSRLRRAFRRLNAGRGTERASPVVLDDVMELGELPGAIQEMYRRDFEAFIRYRPKGRCGDVTVFRSCGQPLFGSHEPDLGWSRIARGTVDVRHLPGNHGTILSEPEVQHLAGSLRDALVEAQARASGWREREPHAA